MCKLWNKLIIHILISNRTHNRSSWISWYNGRILVLWEIEGWYHTFETFYSEESDHHFDSFRHFLNDNGNRKRTYLNKLMNKRVKWTRKLWGKIRQLIKLYSEKMLMKKMHVPKNDCEFFHFCWIPNRKSKIWY